MSVTPIEITLDGAKVPLVCTLGAAKAINSHFGNMVEAYQRVTKMDFEAFPRIIAAAVGKEIKDVEQHVFDEGLENLLRPVTQFLQRLSNGGRDIPVAAQAAGDDRGNG